MMTTLLNPHPSCNTLLHSAWWHGHCTEGYSGTLSLYIYVLYDHWIRQPAKKCKNGGQKWLPLVEVSSEHHVAYIQSVCLKTFSLSAFTKSFHCKSYGLQRSVIARPLSTSRSVSPSWLWLAPSALLELLFTNTSGVREFKTVWNFPSLSH